MNTPTIEELIEKAKARQRADGRSKNRGRPRTGMNLVEANVVSTMRRKGVQSLMTIHSLLKEHSMTKYSNYGTFLAAYKEHKLHS
jgi:hypothetical protein